MSKVTLFCLPFAGGNKYSFRDLTSKFSGDIVPHPIELPGRGSRTNEPLKQNAEDLVEDVFLQIRQKLVSPYAIYGHSMGTLLAYLLTKRIVSENLSPPAYLFLSSGPAPSVFKDKPKYHHLPSSVFFNQIRELGGIPDELLNNLVLLNYFEPVLRADFRITETYVYSKTEPFDIPLLLMLGNREFITDEQVLAWQEETTHPIELRKFSGNHFFIYNHLSELAGLISGKIKTRLSFLKD